MTNSKEKKIIIIAGPNGAGKTTFDREFLPKEAACPIFVNADLIAQGISPFNPETAEFKAGRIMLEEIHEHASKGRSFAFETTLSGRSYARLIKKWQNLGYQVKLFFLWLDAPDIAVERVKQRVREGGHDIPEATIRRRYKAGLQNLEILYKPLVDDWGIYDNTGNSLVIAEERNKG